MTSSRARKVLLLDSHEIFRLGLRAALADRRELSVVGDAGDVTQGSQLVARTRPHVVVVGIRAHEQAVLEKLPALRAQHPPSRVLVLSRTHEDQLVTAALRGGANGYLAKDIEVSQLVAAVHSVAGGHNLLDSTRALRMASRKPVPTAPQPTEGPLARLTPQERRILALIGQGHTNREIAERLHLVEKTVRNHVSRLLAKLGVQRRTQAALLAAQLQRAEQPRPDSGLLA